MQTYTRKIAVTTATGLYFFDPEEIVRLEASSNYTYLYFINRKPILVSKVLSLYENMLTGLGFVRTHRSHLVNTRYIRSIDSTGQIIMQDTSRAEISRRKRKTIMNELKNAEIAEWAA